MTAFADYSPILPLELPISHKFGRSKDLIIEGALGESFSRDQPVVSIMDTSDRVLLSVRIDPEASLMHISNHFVSIN